MREEENVMTLSEVRAGLNSYRHRFAEKWKEVYKEDFEAETFRTKLYASYGIDSAIELYQNKIKHIKNLIENEQDSETKQAVRLA